MLDYKFLSLVKGYCACVFLVYIQKQLVPSILCIVQQNFAYTLRLHFIRNKNAFDIFIVQTDKALYSIIILIDINRCLQ